MRTGMQTRASVQSFYPIIEECPMSLAIQSTSTQPPMGHQATQESAARCIQPPTKHLPTAPSFRGCQTEERKPASSTKDLPQSLMQAVQQFMQTLLQFMTTLLGAVKGIQEGQQPSTPAATTAPSSAVSAVTENITNSEVLSPPTTPAAAPTNTAPSTATAIDPSGTSSSVTSVDDKKPFWIQDILSIASTILGFLNPVAGAVVGIFGKLGGLFKGGLGKLFSGGLGGLFDGGIGKLFGDGLGRLLGGGASKVTNFFKKGLSILG